MSTERKVFLAVVAAAAAVIAALILYPRVQERFLPQPMAAWVAVQPAGADVAVVGPVELGSGTEFTLHAVLEARDRDGAEVFYTEAPALRFPDREIPATALRPWDRARPPRMLWFTVEGGTPFLELGAAEQLEDLHFEELFRPEWPQAWAVPGSLEPAGDEARALRRAGAGEVFGTQRYHLRVEVFEDEDALLPDQRFKSWGAELLPERWQTFPAVTARLEGPLAPASEIFGLTQIEAGAAPPEVLEKLLELTRRRLAFSRVTVLAEVLRSAGKSADDLRWRPLRLDGGAPWGGADGVAVGDLLQVLDRVVLLYRDAGEVGVLDGPDLCFDFARGAAVRPLDQVFDAGSEVRWAALAR